MAWEQFPWLLLVSLDGRFSVDCECFFQQLWLGYVTLAPQAERIHHAFVEDGNRIINDHVAFRTFNLSPLSIRDLEPALLALGYQRYKPYRFTEKKLDAWSYLHEDDSLPRLFFSELRVEDLSRQVQDVIRDLLRNVRLKSRDASAFYAGRLWPVPSWQDYQLLSRESEYAAWLSIMGLCANHFTISVNQLRNNDMSYVLEMLASLNIAMNQAGGILKGTPDDLLVQCSTLADCCEVEFSGGDKHVIPSCYYEFAQRFKGEDGQFYQGFVPANADKIFHSTDQQS